MTDFLHLTRMDSPLGDMIIGFTAQGLALLEYGDSFAKKDLSALYPSPRYVDDERAPALVAQLQEYFAGKRRQFDVELDMRGTDFQRKVWQSLLQIPYGETWSYAEQAVFVGNAKAVRAVAGANARNPVSIIVPCHRVIGSNRRLTGYGGGLARKEALLRLESADFLL